MIRLAIVSPCYNEEPVLESSAAKLLSLLDDLEGKEKISRDSFVLFVNDGSTDGTWSLIERLHCRSERIKGLSLAHNAGHQCAIMAGMMTARTMCDGCITIDADLQDELSCIEQMIDAHAAGSDVVYGVKVERSADSPLKRFTAETYYRMLKAMGVETVFNHADFRFMSRRVLDALSTYPERNLYLRALVPQIGFRSSFVEDHLGKREAGKSKYTPRKMMRLAVDGITSFSEKPLHLIVGAGVIFILISLLIAVYVIVSIVSGHVVAGWSSLMLSVWFVGGVILVAVGITGLYVGKIYTEVKRRPLYNIDAFLD